LISDTIAERTGLTVYCPDIFAGDGVSPEGHSVIAVEDHRSIIAKLSGLSSVGRGHPKLLTHRLVPIQRSSSTTRRRKTARCPTS
jgi:hypothetical protein